MNSAGEAYDTWKTTDWEYEKADKKEALFSAQHEKLVDMYMLEFDMPDQQTRGKEVFSLFTEEIPYITLQDGEREVLQKALYMIKESSPEAWRILRDKYEDAAKTKADSKLNELCDELGL